MGQAQRSSTQQQPIERKFSAAEAIAEVRAQFSLNRAAPMYNRLGNEHKRVICFAAGLAERDIKDKFDKYNHIQRAAIHRAIRKMAPVFNALSHFSLTEFNK